MTELELLRSVRRELWSCPDLVQAEPVPVTAHAVPEEARPLSTLERRDESTSTCTPRSTRLTGVAALLLRWIAGRRSSRCSVRGSATTLTHLLHALPLLRRKNHHAFRDEGIVGGGSTNNHVVAGVNVRHGDAVAAPTQRSIFVEFARLRYVVAAQNREFRRVD